MHSAEQSYEYALQKLLDELDIEVNDIVLTEAKPHIKQVNSIEELSLLMANLNYGTHELNERLTHLDKRLLPLLLVSDEGLFVCQTNGKIYDCRTAGYIDKNKLPTSYRLFFFKPLSKIETNPENILKIISQKYGKYYWQCWLLSFFINLLMLATPIFIIGVYNQVVGTFSPGLLVSYVIGILIAMTGFAVLYLLRSQLLTQTSTYIDSYLGQYTLKHILGLPARVLELSGRVNQINRLRDFKMVREFLMSQPLLFIFDLPFTIIFLIAITALAGWLVIFPVVTIILFLLLFSYSWFLPNLDLTDPLLAREQQQRQMEILSNLAAIRSNNLTNYFFNRYRDLTAEKMVGSTQNNIITNRRSTISDAIIFISTLLLVCFAALRVMNGTIAPGIIIALVILNWRILAPYKGIYAYVDLFKYVTTSFSELGRLFKIKAEEEVCKEKVSKQPIRGKFRFEHVSFRYPDSEQAILNDISFQANPGEIVVITGDTGSGKSTLLKLLLQFYTPIFGEIYLDDDRLEQYPKNWLRHKLAYVPQEFSFIYGTLAQNLRLSNPTASDQALWHVCEMAGIARRIKEMPEGLDTRIRDQELIKHGNSFLQGLALARAYLKNSKVMLLDDPVCYLMDDQVVAFSRFLAVMRGQATVILTTHRPSIMKMANTLIVLDRGRMVAAGNPGKILPQLLKSLG